MAELYSEKELLKRVVDNDRQAFTILYSQHLNNLYRYIFLFTRSKEISEEITQNVFVKIWEHRKILETVTSFKAYLYRSAKNLLLDEIRRKQLATKVLFALKPDVEESYEESDAKTISNQYYQITQDAINLLPEKRKQIVKLRAKDELTLDEIAEKLSISKSVVKKQLYTGMHFIRKYLQKHAEISTILSVFISLCY